MKLHVFYTWLVANLIHPVILYIRVGSISGEFFNDSFLQFYFLGFFYSMLFSLPLLVIAWGLFYLVRKTEMALISKYWAWAFLLMILPFLLWYIIFLFLDYHEYSKDDLDIILPSSFSALAAVLARYSFFFKILSETQTNQSGN